jgi:hypothetical protein
MLEMFRWAEGALCRSTLETASGTLLAAAAAAAETTKKLLMVQTLTRMMMRLHRLNLPCCRQWRPPPYLLFVA